MVWLTILWLITDSLKFINLSMLHLWLSTRVSKSFFKDKICASSPCLLAFSMPAPNFQTQNRIIWHKSYHHRPNMHTLYFCLLDNEAGCSKDTWGLDQNLPFFSSPKGCHWHVLPAQWNHIKRCFFRKWIGEEGLWKGSKTLFAASVGNLVRFWTKSFMWKGMLNSCGESGWRV